MRLGKLTALAGLVVALFALALIWGCSDDDSPTASNLGDLTDPEFVPVKAQVDSTLGTIIADWLNGFNNLYVRPGDTTSVGAQLSPPVADPGDEIDPDTLLSTYSDGWHYVYATYTGSVYFSRTKDSIRYQVDSSPVQNPSASVDFLHIIDNWEFTALDDQVSHTDYSGRHNIQFVDLDTDVATITGDGNSRVIDYYIGVDTTMTHDFNFATIDFDQVQIAGTPGGWVNSCPTAGEIDFDLTYTTSWTNALTSGADTTTFDINVEYEDGTAKVRAFDGTTKWYYTLDLCTPPSN